MTRTRTAIVLLLALVALVLLPLAGWTAAQASHPASAPQSAQERCTEDMGCWDCETMGNGVCGPSSVASAVDSTVRASVTCVWRVDGGSECTWWTVDAQPAQALSAEPRYVG